MKARFTPSADQEFHTVIDYIRQDNPTAAQSYFLRVKQALKRLEQFPNSGRSLPEFPELPHREALVHPYRFIYRTIDDTVWITTVWHGARILKRPEA